MRSRGLLLVSLSVLLFGLVGLTIARFGTPLPFSSLLSPAVSAAGVPAQERHTGERVVEFGLTVERIQWEVEPGRVLAGYAYNGQVPGPELRVIEGDTVRVTVANQLSDPTTIHWHGVEVPVEMDGVPLLSQPPIPPGGSFTYEFVAIPAGTRWYHSHFDELAQQGGGLVGALIIEPREQTGDPTDREYVLVTGEWATATDAGRRPGEPAPPGSGGMMGRGMMDGMMGRGMMGGQDTLPDTFSINGRAYPHTEPLMVRQGERVRLRLVNAGATATQIFALAGHRLAVTHSDGNLLRRPVATEAVMLGVGERVDVEFVADKPGRWQLQGLVPGHAERGLAVDVVYEGHESDPLRRPSPRARFRVARYGDFAGPPHSGAPDRAYALRLSGGMMMGPNVWTINGRSYPYTAPIDVRPGDRVRLRLFNMSMEDHPMHLHGHTFQVVAIGGRRVNGPLKDTLTVRPMEQYEIEFMAGNPGVWLFHCHNLDHMAGGLMAEVHYR